LAANAWIDTYSFVEWLTKIFVPLSKASLTHRVLLLVDCHTTRFTFEAISAADAHGVDILTFPPHASHIMQPLDLAIFGPLKLFLEQYWTELLIESEVTLDRLTLIQTIMRDDVFDKAFTYTNIARGWREGGLYPYNINAVPVHKLTSDSKVTTLGSTENVC
jgi:hypothetical protein